MWSVDLDLDLLSNLLKLHPWHCLHFLAITQSMIESVTVKTTHGHNLCYQFPQNLFDSGVCQNTQNIEESFVSKFGSGYR